MKNYATTKLSSKGQVVIPESVRQSLKLKEGDQFIVMGHGDAVILKSITPPSMAEFENLLSKSRLAASKAKGKPSDVKRAIHKSRRAS